jgi:hypothetical protein
MFRNLQPNYSKQQSYGDEAGEAAAQIPDGGTDSDSGPSSAPSSSASGPSSSASGSASGSTPRAPFVLSDRMVNVIQIVICVIFVYLWFTADTSQGSLARPLWYGAAISLAILSTSSVCLQSRVSWIGILQFVSPLVFIMLYETILQDMDRGTAAIQLPIWLGRIFAIVLLASVSYGLSTKFTSAAHPPAAASSSSSSSAPSLASRILGSLR